MRAIKIYLEDPPKEDSVAPTRFFSRGPRKIFFVRETIVSEKSWSLYLFASCSWGIFNGRAKLQKKVPVPRYCEKHF